MNLLKLGAAKTVDAALKTARETPVITVLPEVITRPEGRFLTIPENAGYGKVEESMTSFRG
jgi:hypothetical protein